MRLFCACFFLFMTVYAHAARIDTFDVYSVSMKKNVRSLVVTPSGYDLDTAARFPVVYLLHGWSGNYAGWLGDAPQLPNLADEYQCILVFPDGGYDSWYLDSKVDSSVRYETHILRELIPQIDQKYKTIAQRQGRAICGLSMGGHGALYLSFRNPEFFVAAGSICGGVDLRPFKRNDWDLVGVLGSPRKNWQNWQDASVVNLVSKLNPADAPKLIVDCGLGDFFLDVNRSLRQLLLENKIEHEYTERPGEHNADYWCNAIDVQMLFFAKVWGRR
jgi:S-formylglutathione hydrolase FrmB